VIFNPGRRAWFVPGRRLIEVALNWLAHVFLSEANVEFRLGNLLADLVRGEELARMPEEFRRGAARHKRIDAFTDAHPIVRRSRSRIEAPYRRFSGVLVDIFYDYCLARRWPLYATESLNEFTSTFYAAVRAHPLALPESARATVERIVTHDLLGQYAQIAGVANSLRRVSGYLTQRWGRDFRLDVGAQLLVAQESAFMDDFAEFFPQLQAHVA
jgi:acyl carrier protein phosphodiesterase